MTSRHAGMTVTELLQCNAEETVTADQTLIDTRDRARETKTDEALHRPDDMHHPMTQRIATLGQPEMNPGATATTGAIAHGLRMPVDVDMWTETAKATDPLDTTAGVGAEAGVGVLSVVTDRHILGGRRVER
ncbi:MAG: hypothetical protein Q9202_000778 [Teloschistes flavicans]